MIGAGGTHNPAAQAAGRVSALVVTYNRRHLVRECLEAILAQTRRPDRIVVLDNGSDDGTVDHLRQCGLLADGQVSVIRFDRNHGPAVAFSAGFAEFRRSGFDWAWVMDDDVVPDPTALAALLEQCPAVEAAGGPPGFLCSAVRAPNGVMMNVPDPDMRAVGKGYPDWNRLLGQGIVKVRKATFVSILVPAATVREVGLPSPDFFMWGEDVDYTLRITARRPGWLVGTSRVVHLRASPSPPGVETEVDPARFPLLRHYYRNILFIRRRHYGFLWFLAQWLVFLRVAWRTLSMRPFSAGRTAAVWSGLMAGLVFEAQEPNPRDLDELLRTVGGQPVALHLPDPPPHLMRMERPAPPLGP